MSWVIKIKVVHIREFVYTDDLSCIHIKLVLCVLKGVNKLILISVIIPFYKGNQYISNLLKCLEKNEKLLEKYGEDRKSVV